MRAEPKIITAASPAARDPVGLYRFGAIVAATVAASTAAIVLRERPDRKRRVVASVALAASAGVITRGIANPAVAAKRFVEERPLVYAAGLAPVLAAPALSRSFGPAHMTSITGIGFASAMVGKKRGDAISGIAAGWWLGWTLLRAEGIRGIRSNPKRTLDFLVLPLGYVATARLTPVAILAAHELSMLQQKDEAANKEVAGLESYRVELERTSTALRRALIDVLQGPAAPSSSHAVRDLAWRALGRLEERAAVVAAADPDVRPIDELLAGVVAVFQDASTAEGRDSIQLRRIEIDDPRIRGLLGAGLAGALSNARRHQPGVPHEIEIAQPTPDRVRLTVRSTSATRRTSKAGAGLKHLRDQVEDDAREASRPSRTRQGVGRPSSSCQPATTSMSAAP